MAKFVLMSIIIGTIAMPAFASRDANAMRGLKKTILLSIVFNLFYLFAVRFIYPRL
jgi:hypothetical protein